MEIIFLVLPLVLNGGLQAAQAAQHALQRITAAFQHRPGAHLVDAVLQDAAHRLVHQLLSVSTHLIDRLVVEGQAVGARLDNAVHLLFELLVQPGQAGAHVAALTYLFGDDLIQRDAALFDARQRAVINPWQRGTQIGLIIFRLLTLCGGQVVLLAVIGDVSFRRNHQIAVLAFDLHGLRAQHHVITRGDATLIIRMGGKSGCHQSNSQQRFAHL